MHVIKYANFQLHGGIFWQTYLEELTIGDTCINKRVQLFIHQMTCVAKLAWWEEKGFSLFLNLLRSTPLRVEIHTTASWGPHHCECIQNNCWGPRHCECIQNNCWGPHHCECIQNNCWDPHHCECIQNNCWDPHHCEFIQNNCLSLLKKVSLKLGKNKNCCQVIFNSALKKYSSILTSEKHVKINISLFLFHDSEHALTNSDSLMTEILDDSISLMIC